jgi:hypothetical protein
MRTRALLTALPVVCVMLAGCVLLAGCVMLAGCGSESGHASQTASARQAKSAEEVSFLRDCNRGVGAQALGDAAVCQCTLTQVEAETNPRTFKQAVADWKTNTGGASYRSTVAQAIARCSGQQQVASAPRSTSAVVPSNLPPARTVKLSRSAYAKHYRWPTSARSMVHSCLDGTAVANGMSCAFSQAIGHAFGKYPDSHAPVVRHLNLVDPVNGRVVSVDCALSGREDASAICNAPQHQIALLPPPDYED